VNDLVCCYVKPYASQETRACTVLHKSEILTFADESPFPYYEFACSSDQLSNRYEKCYLYDPINKNSCFSRTLSDSEKTEAGGFTPNKCCYYEFDSLKFCMAMDGSKLDEYIQALKEAGQNVDNLNIICQDPSTTSGGDNGNNQNNEPGSGGSTNNGDTSQNCNSSQFSRNNKLILIMFLMFLSI